MKIYLNPARCEWSELQSRNAIQSNNIEQRVRQIIDRIVAQGDSALRELTKDIDKLDIENVKLPHNADDSISKELAQAIEIAVRNIKAFHCAQIQQPVDIETMPGVRCVQRSVPIERVGLYVPGGSAPLFSTVLMLAIPAMVAGCRQVVLCSPPPIAPAIVYAAKLCGVTEIFQVGGAMAIAAMAYGTESVPKVDKIFGPGNQWVTCAKQIVAQAAVAIDMPAGPSEVMVMADETANAEFVAADMLSQAEHGADSQAIVICSNQKLAQDIVRKVNEQKQILGRAEVLDKSLQNCRVIVLPDHDDMIDFANGYAAEHLIISMKNAWDVANKITAGASIFIGNYSPESVGDYASGTNHTLPTYGWAKSYSGVNIDSFVKKITYQELTKEALINIAPYVTTMAISEGLQAHANAVIVRNSNK